MMKPEIGMRVRLKQESDFYNNGTSKTIPEGTIGTVSKFDNYVAEVHFDNPNYEYPDRDYHFPIAWLQFKRGS